MMETEPYVESFSEGYAIVQDAEIRTWNEDEAHMDYDLYFYLEDLLDEPVIGMVDGVHYHFKPSEEVLSKQCAVPKQNRRAEEPSVLLVRK